MKKLIIDYKDAQEHYYFDELKTDTASLYLYNNKELILLLQLNEIDVNIASNSDNDFFTVETNKTQKDFFSTFGAFIMEYGIYTNFHDIRCFTNNGLILDKKNKKKFEIIYK